MSETIALDRKKQSRFSKKIRNVKNKVASGDVIVKENIERKPAKGNGVVYIGHIPHGFYENEMNGYLTQFGKVKNLVICRSHRSGRSKGYAFIEFEDDDVAKIVAETMNNYLMFNRRLVANYIPFEKRPPKLFIGKVTTPKNYSLKQRRDKMNRLKNTNPNKESYIKQTQKHLTRLNAKLNKLKELGIEYDFEPVDIPKEVLKKREIKKQVKKRTDTANEEKSETPENKMEIKVNEKKLSQKMNIASSAEAKKNNKLISVKKTKKDGKPLQKGKKVLKLAIQTALNDKKSCVNKNLKTIASITNKNVKVKTSNKKNSSLKK